jgi:hypothetical protein
MGTIVCQSDPVEDNCEISEEGKDMKGHIKLFVLRMDLEKASQLKMAKAEEFVGLSSCGDAFASVNRTFQQAPQGLISGR